LTEQLGIAHCLAKRIHHLSHGEKQRVAICRALINEPRIILADEPTSNLDPDNKSWVLSVLQDYIRQHSAALVLATHDHQLLDHFEKIVDLRVAKNV